MDAGKYAVFASVFVKVHPGKGKISHPEHGDELLARRLTGDENHNLRRETAAKVARLSH
jgi:hypothetical protein